jgi:excisionase family DNA binding protein
MNRPLFSKRELAEHLSVSTRTIDRLCREGRLRFRRVGSRKRFSYDDVLAYLDRNHVRPQKDSFASHVN